MQEKKCAVVSTIISHIIHCGRFDVVIIPAIFVICAHIEKYVYISNSWPTGGLMKDSEPIAYGFLSVYCTTHYAAFQMRVLIGIIRSRINT